ncbi:MAG TPA: SEC-C metal-binding domain-containing protein, partial [Chthoniobacterales bacterium]
RPKKALMLLIAAGWWQKFRKGPLPAALVQEARALARLRPVNGESAVLLAGLVSLAPNEALQDLVPCGHDPKILQNAPQLRDGFLAMMNENFEAVVPEKQSHDYNLGRPMRRAVEDIGRNKLCPCESGEKYKRCCEKKDRERLRHSTDVAGKTDMELHDIPHANLSAARLETMPPHELVRLQEVPEELMELYFQRLAECKCFDSLTRIFKRAGVRKEWEAAWKRTFSSIVREWQRKAALRLLKTQRNWKEMLPALEPGVRLLLASRKEKEFLRTLEAEAIAALRSGDEQEIERFASAVVASPYPGLGIFVARSVLPLLEDPKRAASVFDRILHARDRLALSPDDEFGDFMDERALQKKNNHGTQVAAAQAKLSAKAEELRRLKESLATAKRALALQEKREAREAVASTPAKSSEHDEENRKLREKVDWLQAKIREEGAEKLGYLRDLVRLQEELKTVKASPNGSQGPEIQDEEDAGEQLEVSGTQPVRMLEFPKKFEQTLAAFPQHVGRATMAYLGQLAGGEATAFDTVVHLKAYHGVLRKKIAGSHRLLFTLESDRVRVVDLIDRCDLDRRIKKLQAHGLPAA